MSFGQDISINEYYDDGKKVIEKTWEEGDQIMTLIEIQSDNSSEYRYFINEKGIKVGLNIYYVKDYGKYFKVDVSIVNNTEKRIDYLEENISVVLSGAKGYYPQIKLVGREKKDTIKYRALKFKEYNHIVKRRQFGNSFLMGFTAGLSNASAGTTYSQSNTYYNGYNSYGYANTYTTTYSPALASMQYQQNQQNLNTFKENQNERMKYINEGYLKDNTIFPSTTLQGYFLIPYKKKIKNIDIILKLDGKEFDFSADKWDQ